MISSNLSKRACGLADLLNHTVRIKSHVLASRIIMDIVITNAAKRGIKLNRKTRLMPHSTTRDGHHCQWRPSRHASNKQWYADPDGHMKGRLGFGKVCHVRKTKRQEMNQVSASDS